MKKKQFIDSPGINTGYLESTYADNLGQAHIVFSQYLRGLPSILSDLEGSVEHHDIYVFRDLILKLMPLFSSVGLTDVADKLQELQAKCITAKDIVLYDIEIRELIKTITSSTDGIQQLCAKLAAA
jgi:hypothetical protein